MPDCSTSYMGLRLRNPIIVASSGLTRNIDHVMACERAGAGAVVLKSLFEEVLARQDYGLKESTVDHTEAYDYYYAHLELLYGSKDYTDLIREAKVKTSIPVIASINCVSAEWWPDFAAQVEAAGADALELNVFATATDLTVDGRQMEELYYRILTTVKSKVGIPVALKISPYFSSLPNVAVELGRRDLDGLVLFNRFTQPDIDIKERKLKTTFTWSSADEIHLPLRWTAMMSHYLPYDLCASTGIKSAEDVIKLLLAGASSVQLASVLYQKGLDIIPEMVAGITEWMTQQHYDRIDDFRGSLSFHRADDAAHYLRSQFMEKIREVE
ncbi:MAG: dihydroorotate dehydrogenase-like protein [Bacteroidetes bacterium]|nr:dihydroorotate dehydrogenase-like protein [Bacteroidota bacterium]